MYVCDSMFVHRWVGTKSNGGGGAHRKRVEQNECLHMETIASYFTGLVVIGMFMDGEVGGIKDSMKCLTAAKKQVEFLRHLEEKIWEACRDSFLQSSAG